MIENELKMIEAIQRAIIELLEHDDRGELVVSEENLKTLRRTLEYIISYWRDYQAKYYAQYTVEPPDYDK